MPIYEYECQSCGHVFEVITGFSRNGTRKCEKCGASAKRLISPAGIVFKGSGFHKTDYGKSSSDKSSDKRGKDITPKKEEVKSASSSSETSD